MPQIEKSALVPFSAQQMYQLVNDVEQYSEFLPACQSAVIDSQSEAEMVATLSVAAAGIQKSFTTKNTLQPYHQIDMRLEQGPFKYLHGVWQFKKLDEQACKVEFKLDFEFSNKLAAIAFGGVFSQFAESMVQAFIQRAKTLAQG